MSNILFVSGFLPSSKVPSGGQQIVYDILKDISKNNTVTLIAFYNEHERVFFNENDFSFCKEVKFFKISILSRILAIIRFPLLPITASVRFYLAKKWLPKYIQNKNFDQVIFEFMQVAELLRLCNSVQDKTIVVHDIFHESILRRSKYSSILFRWLYAFEVFRTKRWESEVFLNAQKIITLTKKDKIKIEKIRGRGDVIIRYPVRKMFSEINRSATYIKKGTILFFGQMSRMENVDGITWFVSNVFPLIIDKNPNATLVIAGANPPKEVQNLSSNRIIVMGFVDDPVEIFLSAHIAIAPLRIGSGVKIKVVEYISAGIPTVATSVGAEGIDDSSLLYIADSKERFCNICCELLDK